MDVDVVISFSFTQFTPFKTEAFNKRPGMPEIEVTDRAQLRSLLKANRMVEMGDSSNYFGSSSKSVPTWDELSKSKNHGGDPKLSKLVNVSKDPVGDIKKLDLAADQTDFGRRQSATRPEFVIGRP